MGVKKKHNCTSSPVSILWANKMMKIAVPKSSQKGGTKTSIMDNSKEKEKKVCLCAPTTHPGSFKCRHHRSIPSSSSSKYKSVGCKSHKTGLSRFGKPPAAAAAGEHEFPSESP